MQLRGNVESRLIQGKKNEMKKTKRGRVLCVLCCEKCQMNGFSQNQGASWNRATKNNEWFRFFFSFILDSSTEMTVEQKLTPPGVAIERTANEDIPSRIMVK